MAFSINTQSMVAKPTNSSKPVSTQISDFETGF